jgi:hypothetical protein
VLTSPDLTGSDTLPLVVVGTDTVTARYAPPDSLIATAPAKPGLFDVRVAFRGQSPTAVGMVQLAGGYAGVWTVGPIGGRPQAWPGSPQTSFAVAMDSGLALVDPRLRTIRRVLPDTLFDINRLNGVGPAAGGRIVGVSWRGATLALTPEPLSVQTDTGPLVGGYRFAAQLAPGRWLLAYHHGVASYLRNASGGWDVATTAYHIEEPFDVVVSPLGDRTVIVGRDVLGTGMPVFSAPSPNPAYFLSGFHEIWGAAFSDAGDTLFVVGPAAADSQPNLAIVAASDGRVLKSIRAWWGTYRLMLDPAGRWIYLVGAAQDTSSGRFGYNNLHPALEVLDRATLKRIALLLGDESSQVGTSDIYPILSPAEPRIYYVITCAFCGAGPASIYAFDLMR